MTWTSSCCHQTLLWRIFNLTLKHKFNPNALSNAVQFPTKRRCQWLQAAMAFVWHILKWSSRSLSCFGWITKSSPACLTMSQCFLVNISKASAASQLHSLKFDKTRTNTKKLQPCSKTMSLVALHLGFMTHQLSIRLPLSLDPNLWSRMSCKMLVGYSPQQQPGGDKGY